MLRKTGMFSLLSATLLGVISLPAQADNATVQTSTQQAVINGNNNQIIQVINQTNVINRSGRGSQRRTGRNSSATVQDAYQGASVNGHDNRVIQESNQAHIEPGSRRRRRRFDREREDWDDHESRGRHRWDRDDDDDDDDDD